MKYFEFIDVKQPNYMWIPNSCLKSLPVCNDILTVAFNRKFINEIFVRPQPMYSKRAVKAMFERIANASTIRVSNENFERVSYFIEC